MISNRIFSNIIFAFVLLVTQLHLLRNLSFIYYIFFAIAFFTSIFILKTNWRHISADEKTILVFLLVLVLFPVFPMFIHVFFGLYADFNELFIAFSRLVFCLPIYFVFLSARPNKETLNFMIVLCVVVTFFAAVSIPYQFYSGPIEWFAESSERAGLSRFASLFGSLTALGLVCGFGIMAAAISISSAILFPFLSFGIIIGSVLSLQKAALFNLLVSFFVIPFLTKFNFKFFFSLLFLIILFGLFGLYVFGDELDVYLSSLSISSELGSSGYSDDVSFLDGAYERIFDLPSVAIAHHGVSNLFLGVGPKGGSGAFGFPDIPMSHNGIVDLFLIGGLIYFFIFSFFIFHIFKLIHAAQSSVVDRKYFIFGVLVFFGIIVNIPFSGLIFFTPSNAMFFALALKIILMCKQRGI